MAGLPEPLASEVQASAPNLPEVPLFLAQIAMDLGEQDTWYGVKSPGFKAY